MCDSSCLSRVDGLRQKLERQGLKDVTYMVVNHQGEEARRLHAMLAQRLSENITLYKQEEQQPDVWQNLGGEKDDFLIYDRFVTSRELTPKQMFFCLFPLYLFWPLSLSYFDLLLLPDVVVLPTTFHSHTPSSDKVILRVQSKIPTANLYVGTAHMRYGPHIHLVKKHKSSDDTSNKKTPTKKQAH